MTKYWTCFILIKWQWYFIIRRYCPCRLYKRIRTKRVPKRCKAGGGTSASALQPLYSPTVSNIKNLILGCIPNLITNQLSVLKLSKLRQYFNQNLKKKTASAKGWWLIKRCEIQHSSIYFLFISSADLNSL